MNTGKKLKKKKIKDHGSSKKKRIKGYGLRIVDDDGFGLPPAEAQTTSEEEEVDELPQIAAVVDERPREMQLQEEFKQGKWKQLGLGQVNEPNSRANLALGQRVGHSRSPDLSPPRSSRNDSEDFSPPRSRKQNDSVDFSPPRSKGSSRRNHVSQRSRKGSDSDDFSPPRRKRKSDSEGVSPSRSKRKRSDSDISPPRSRKRHDSDDFSPPRPRRIDSEDLSPPRSRRNDSEDLSPPRIRNRENASSTKSRRHDKYDRRDLSPPRSSHRRTNRNSPQRGHKTDDNEGGYRRIVQPEILEDSDVQATTMDGKKAGLQKAHQLRQEMIAYKQRENEFYANMDDEISGRNAATKVRDKQTGKERDFAAELAKKEQDDKKEEEKKKLYDKWGKGLKQVAEREQKLQDAMHEISKPLARTKDDSDLDAYLKSQIRDGDPMLKFLSAKKKEEKRKYLGPPPAPNRFGIAPGCRWDGVDRSNGYEKEWFNRINARKALQEESYKWSVEDL